MPNVEVVIKTSAQLGGINQTIAALDRLTEAERRATNSARESAAVFDEQRKRFNVTNDQAQYLASLTQEAKASDAVDAATKRLTVSKRGFKDVIDGLKKGIPETGLLLTLLKSPIAI